MRGENCCNPLQPPWLWAKIKVKSCHHGVHRFLNCFKMFFLGRFHFNYPCTQVENPARIEGMEGYNSDHDLITCKGKEHIQHINSEQIFS